MKNVQVIDAADNCAYHIYAFTDDEFSIVFPGIGQNIEFIEDALERVGADALDKALRNVWARRIKKEDVRGINGTLFYELRDKKKYYPTKKEEEMVSPF